MNTVLLAIIAFLSGYNITPGQMMPINRPVQDPLTAKPLSAHLNPQEERGRAKSPQIVLWAWERPENLEFIDPQKIGVAFLATSVKLSGNRVILYSRRQPLRVPQRTYLIAVVRLSTNTRSRPFLGSQQRNSTVRAIIAAARIPGVRAVQIDFDAGRSERPFYRALIRDVRASLPDSIKLSMTALVSWCLSDPWIRDLPVDEAIPMLFRLGPDHVQVLHHLQSGKDFAFSLCNQSLGISMDEPIHLNTKNRRVYIFNPRPWSSQSVKLAVREFNL
ncbi:MAG: DUF3142 domain-containing protein [Bacteroidota bacterium]